MVQVKEIELPRRYSISDIQNILGYLKDVDVIYLKNCVMDVKVLKVDIGVTLYLIFGERYRVDECDRGHWDRITYITDDLDDLMWFINGL
jgi:hypothetical protein